MAIDRISFHGLERTEKLPQSNKIDSKKDDNTNLTDKEKSTAAKYMIGASALALTVAIGIIGHKNNWWRRAQDAGESLSKKGSDVIGNGERKAGNTADDIRPEVLEGDNVNPHSGESIPDPKSKPDKQPAPVPKEEPAVKRPVDEQKPVETPQKQDTHVEPPKPELKGVDLIKSNLESLDSEMGEEKIIDILDDTLYEIDKLPAYDRLSYFDDYLAAIKKVQDVWPEKLPQKGILFPRPFDIKICDLSLTPAAREKYVDKLIEFAKENPKFEYPVADCVSRVADDFSFMADPDFNLEGLRFIKSLYNSGLKHDPNCHRVSYCDSVFHFIHSQKTEFRDIEKEYSKFLFKFDLKSGMPDTVAERLIDDIWENPDVYEKLFDVSPIKLDSAIRKSYNELTGKTLNYTSSNSAKGYKQEIKNKLSNPTYIDKYTIDYYLLPHQKKGAWPMDDMKKYYEKDLNFDAAFKALEAKEEGAITRCKNVISRLPKEVQPQLYAKYLEALKKYSPNELSKFSFGIHDLQSAEQFLSFAKENPQYKQLVSDAVLESLKGYLPKDSDIEVLKLLKNNNADFSSLGMNYLKRRFEPFAFDVYYKNYVDAIEVSGGNLVKVGKEKATEFRRLAFDLYIKNGITQKDAEHYIKQSDTHLPELLGMSKEEFLNKINSAVRKD